jgi:hypothetical protein
MSDATYPSTPSFQCENFLATFAFQGKTIKRHLTQDASCMELTYAGGFVGVNLGRGSRSSCPDSSGTEVKLAIEDVWSYPSGDLTALVDGQRLFFDRVNQAITTDSTHWWFGDVIESSTIATYGRFKFKFRINQGEEPGHLDP